jgi:phosphomannomutase
MQVDSSIFKSYDIRGIYGQNLFDETAEAVAKAFVKFLKPKTVILGRDGRVSGPALHDAMIKGFTQSGVDVIDIGMISTDMYYFACATMKLPGVMITASHNPKEYNGFKMVKQIPYLLSGDDGIQDLRKIIESDDFADNAQVLGKVSTQNIMEEYTKKILSLVPDLASLKKFKVVVDTCNGMVGPSFANLAKYLPNLTVVPMYFEVDGTFPNHGGDPLLAENRKELEERVVSEGADLGFAFDPDGDRFFCIDKKGRFVSGDFMTSFLSKYFLNKQPGSSIVYDIRASYAVPDTISSLGGKPLYNKVGHSFIKKRMMDENAVFGGEVSGHYYFADFFYCDSGLAPMIFLLDLLSKSEKTLDQMIDELGVKYFISGEINTKGVDSTKVFKALEEKYGSLSVETLNVDGVSMKFDGWHFNVRSSNTEPLVRLNLEATSQVLMEGKRDEVLSIIRS